MKGRSRHNGLNLKPGCGLRLAKVKYLSKQRICGWRVCFGGSGCALRSWLHLCDSQLIGVAEVAPLLHMPLVPTMWFSSYTSTSRKAVQP